MNSGLLATLLVGGLAIGGTGGYILGVNQGKTKAISQIVPTNATDTSKEALAYIGGTTYTKADLPSSEQSKLYSIEHETFHQKENFVKELAMRIALVKQKGDKVDLQTLPPLESLLEKPTPSDEELKAFFEENKNRLPPNTEFEQIKPQLAQFLTNKKMGDVFNQKWESLIAAGTVKMLLAQPIAPIVSIPIEKFPYKGNAGAENVLVEISDYLCPHCQSVHPQVKEVMTTMGEKVKLVQINFSLRPDNLSGSLAEGAFCAQKQSSEAFWKYHDQAFEGKWGSMNDARDNDKALEVAKAAGIDEKQFTECMSGDEAKAFVKEAADIAGKIGVTGTPSFFLNNRRLNLDHGQSLADLIKKELESSRVGG